MSKELRKLQRGVLLPILGAVLFTLAACGADTGTAPSAAPELPPVASGDSQTPVAPAECEAATIRVATAVSFYSGYMTVIAHEELGTFDGLNFDIEVISATTPTMGAVVAAGEADIVLAGGAALLGLETAGVPIKFVAKILGPWDNYVIVANNGNYAGAKSMQELAGANFGITGAGSPGNYLLYRYAEQLGIEFTETALGDFGSLFAALAGGAVDAVIWAPDQAFRNEKLGTATSFYLPDPHPNIMQAFGVTPEFLEEHPECVKDFLSAHYSKVAEMQADPSLFTDVMVGWGGDLLVAQQLIPTHLNKFSSPSTTNGTPSAEQFEGAVSAVPFMTGKPGTTPPAMTYVPWNN